MAHARLLLGDSIKCKEDEIFRSIKETAASGLSIRHQRNEDYEQGKKITKELAPVYCHKMWVRPNQLIHIQSESER